MVVNPTPGQWAVRTISDRHIWIESGSIVVAVIDGSNDPDDDRVEADARLIAAAPDLLAALEGMLDPDTEGDIERAIVALAKAKGLEAPEAAIRVVRQAAAQWADLQSETEAIDGDQVV